jgi:hypothetical protein
MTSSKWCSWRGTMHSGLEHSCHGGGERPTVNARSLGGAHSTRLETRTKESMHMCEYMLKNTVCAMSVAVGTRAPTANGDLRRGV